MTLWDVFAAVAERYGDRIAIELQRRTALEQWTYRDLHRTACNEANRFEALGLRPGDRCAILADNDPRWCAAYLALLHLGAVAVPLDTNYSAAELSAVLADAQPRLLLTAERLEAVAREARIHGAEVTLERLGDRASAGDVSTTPRRIDERSTAVILYTSGITSAPKGVMLTHANLVAQRDAALAVVRVSERDSVLGVLPLFHALAQLANLLLPLAAGARVVFLETLNSSELVRALTERRITIFAGVPQFFYLLHDRILAEAARAGIVERLLLRTLLAACFRLRRSGINLGPVVFGRVHRLVGRQMRLFVTGGSQFDPAIGRDFYALGFTMRQAYALTETSGAATITRPDEAHLDTVGRVLPGQQLCTLPAEHVGLDGEIAIRGPIVMQGYYNRPDATAAVMRDGWLLTGDLGRLDEAGRLTITGRKKEVIVLASGSNVFPEDVEAQYRRSAFVKEICVMGLTRDEGPTSERLYAVVVPDADLLRARRIVNAGDLLRFEIEGQSVHLPPYKRVLDYELWFDPLPRTTTGKLKRHEIERRVRGRRHAATARADAAPYDWRGDAHAQAVAEVIARRMNGVAVVPDANLELDLGLDSMERVELIAELEQRLGVHLAAERANDILTVGQLIEAVRTRADAPAAASVEDSWAVLLSELPPASDPVLLRLQTSRRATPFLLYVALRLLRLVMPTAVVGGREHLPPRGPYIISPNHQSYLDPFFLCSVLPFAVFKQLFFVGAAEYFETPLASWAAKQFNLVPVDPDANLVPAMRAGAFGLTRGKILVLFPEGERSIDGRVKRFKKGAAILARHVNVPIVPVAIHGIFELWPRNRSFNWRMLVPGSGHRIQVAFGLPIRVGPELPYSAAATALRDRVVELWEQLDSSPQEAAEERSSAHRQPEGGFHDEHVAAERRDRPEHVTKADA